MKTIYSLKEIANQLKDFAKANGKGYSSVHIELTNYGSGRTEVEYKMYVEDAKWVGATTPEEAFKKLDEHFNPKVLNQDVELFISKEDEERLTTYNPDADPCFNN